MQELNSDTRTLTASAWNGFDFVALVKKIKNWGKELGLSLIHI